MCGITEEHSLLSPQRKSFGNRDGMQMIGLPVLFVKHETTLLPRGMTVNRYSEVGIEVNMNHSYIVKKVEMDKILVNSCFISR